jgi:hypothetical protein
MPRMLTVRPGERLVLDKPVATVEPLGNEVLVQGPDIEHATVDGSEIFEAGGAVLRLTATKTARVRVVYLEELGPGKLAEIEGEAKAEAEAA